MKVLLFAALIFSFSSSVSAQHITSTWYSEATTDGITIQNSYPKGGPYKGPTEKHYNFSYLVFVTRVVNETETPLDLDLSFSADSIPIPDARGTFMKVFLPPDTMTLEKRNLFSYGITELASLEESTRLHRIINPQKDALFYVVAIFYQTKAEVKNQSRGGNRAELVLKGQDLIYNLLPQVDGLPCGRIVPAK